MKKHYSIFGFRVQVPDSVQHKVLLFCACTRPTGAHTTGTHRAHTTGTAGGTTTAATTATTTAATTTATVVPLFFVVELQ